MIVLPSRYLYPKAFVNLVLSEIEMIRTTCIFVIMSLLIACKSTKTSTRSQKKVNFFDLILLAWNEDTVNSYQFAVATDLKFYYKIVLHDSLKVEFNYGGVISRRSSFDTLFLEYDKRGKPLGLSEYLVKEVSGTYFIQFFDNSSKQIFLRRQNVNHWFRF